MSHFKILAISGSLRKGSYNTAALRAAQELAPAGVTVEIADISDIPMYNDDIRNVGYPAKVQRLRAQIAAADALLFAIPEYNYAVSSPLKNAFDWVSRPPDQPMNNKAVALVSASGGPLGGIRGQYAMRHMLISTNSFCVNNPQVVIGGAPQKFDENGKFNDQVGRDLLKQLLENLVKLARQLRAPVAE